MRRGTKNSLVVALPLALAVGCSDDGPARGNRPLETDPDASPPSQESPTPAGRDPVPSGGGAPAAPAPGEGGGTEDAAAGAPAEPEPEAEPISLSYEAEDGVLEGLETASDRVGFSGSGYVTSFDSDGDELTLDVDVPVAGVYS